MAPILLLSWLAACDPVAQDSGGVPGDLDVHGAFQLELVPEADGSGQAAILGRLYDGATPENVIWEIADTDGSCELLTPRIPFCDPGCTGSEACVEDGVCEPYPTAIDAGLVTVEGVETVAGEAGFTMESIAGYYQPPAGVALAWPPFAEGDVVRFSAAGSAASAPFSMTAHGIAPLEVTSGTVDLPDGESVTVTWTQSSQPDLADLFVSINISYHAGTKGLLRCEVSDTGSLQLSASLLDGLKALGVSGWPIIVYSRVSEGTSDPQAPARLFVESSVTDDVTIPGLVSCTGDADCPDGQSCLGDFQCG